MTLDLMLVSRRAPTDAGLREACAAAARLDGLGEHQLVGLLADEDPMVEISADVSHGELLLQVFRPGSAGPEAVAPYAGRLGVAAPTGDDGTCWLTPMAMSGSASEAETRAVVGVVQHLAQATEGYLVVNGELTPLEGVAPPRPAEQTVDPRPESPASRVFLEAFLTTPAPDEAGWRAVLGRIGELVAPHPELFPTEIRDETGWQPFAADNAAPEWWPTDQQLRTPEPPVRWGLDGAGFAGDRYTQVSAALDVTTRLAEDLLAPLTAVRDLDYGVLHVWQPAEDRTGGMRSGPDGPWLLVTARDLGEALPDLYWAQVFGPPWVELFGADRLAATPAHRVEEVGDGRWLVQLTEHLADVVEDHDAFTAARAAAKEHLGADCFRDAERRTTGSTRAARIPTLGDRGLA